MKMQFFLVALYLLLTVAGLVFIKLGVNSVDIGVRNNLFNITMSWQSIVGYACYLGSFILYTFKILRDFDLSYITPLCMGVSQILILLAALFIFKEEITIISVIAIALIILGVVLLNINFGGSGGA